MTTPRVIRIGHAHGYLGMDRATFNRAIRPYVSVIKLSKQARGIERVDLDRAFDDYKKEHTIKPAKERKCQNAHPVSILSAVSGRSTSKSPELDAYEKAREQVILRRQKSS